MKAHNNSKIKLISKTKYMYEEMPAIRFQVTLLVSS